MPSGCYLLHLDPPYKHAAHYLGYADDIQRRIEEHEAGAGARLTQVAVGAGCRLVLARIWPGAGKAYERTLKKQRGSSRLCPICKEAHP